LSSSKTVTNQSSIKLTENEKSSHRTKHIDTKYYFARDLVSNGKIELKYVPTDDNIADFFTKPLKTIKLKKFRELAGLIEVSSSLRDGVES
jgi:hypothetical protein